MKKWLAWLAFGLVMAVSAAAFAQAQVPPTPTNSIYIQDYANVVSSDTRAKINDIGAKLAARTKAQLVVVTVKSLEGAAPEEYALSILRQWGVGDKTLNNGLVMLVAVNDRQSRIEVGYGLEGTLPDAKTGRIQDQYMIPYFQQNDYDKGIYNGYLALVQEAAKEYNVDASQLSSKPAARVQHQPQQSFWDTLPWWVQMTVFAGVIVLLLIDWIFFGGTFTWLILSLFFRRGGGGGGGGGGYGGGSGGGGGSSRRW